MYISCAVPIFEQVRAWTAAFFPFLACVLNRWQEKKRQDIYT
jgi:hypothetical protein